MKSDVVRLLTDTFEAHAQQTDGGVEYWLACDLQRNGGTSLPLSTRRNSPARCPGTPSPDHFVDVNKMVELGSGSQREVRRVIALVPVGTFESSASNLLLGSREAEELFASLEGRLTFVEFSRPCRD